MTFNTYGIFDKLKLWREKKPQKFFQIVNKVNTNGVEQFKPPKITNKKFSNSKPVVKILIKIFTINY